MYASAKNWSLLYPDRHTPVLSPAYDLVATVPYLPGDKSSLSREEPESDEITPDQIRRFADTMGLPMTPVRSVVRETVERTWGQRGGSEGSAAAEMRKVIGEHIEMVATTRDDN